MDMSRARDRSRCDTYEWPPMSRSRKQVDRATARESTGGGVCNGPTTRQTRQGGGQWGGVFRGSCDLFLIQLLCRMGRRRVSWWDGIPGGESLL